MFDLTLSQCSFCIPKWDVAAIGGRLSYQLAPLLLTYQERESNLTKQTGIINVCFSASILLGLGLTFAIDSAIAS